MHFTTATVLYFELNTVFQTESTSCASSDTPRVAEQSPVSAEHQSAECNIPAGKLIYFHAAYAEQEHCRLTGSEKVKYNPMFLRNMN